MRFFNTTGPITPEDHYHLAPLDRLNEDELMALIQQKKYFVLHAPRQTGKTSALLALMAKLNAEDTYRCLYINVEVAQGYRENIDKAMNAILVHLARQAEIYLDDLVPEQLRRKLFDDDMLENGLEALLTHWSAASPKPLVLLIDEIDALVGDTLITVLRQLRAGYTQRPSHFPQTIILCGVRDVRDYRIHSSREKSIITGGSAFNVKAKSLRLGNFVETEVYALLQQHTQETRQVFADDAQGLIWHYTQGQPWLVNALAYELCFELPEGKDRTRHLTALMVDHAKERLILRRDTHLDQLIDKLQEPRVHRVIAPILAGIEEPEQFKENDLSYVYDLGLIQLLKGQPVKIANPIYQEVIPRELVDAPSYGINQRTEWYVNPDGRLDIGKLLAAFQQFFREHSQSWQERFQYKEAGPQLLIQAFLQRIVNGGGRIDREYGLGRGRTDLLIQWPPSGAFTPDSAVQRVVIELKIQHGSRKTTTANGITQTLAYADSVGAEESHLVIFDRDPHKPWADKLYRETHRSDQGTVIVWGM